MNDTLLKAEMVRISKLIDLKKGNVIYQKQIGLINAQQEIEENKKIDKEKADAETKANEAFAKNRIEARKQEVEVMKQLELKSVNDKLKALSEIDSSTLSEKAREKQLEEIEKAEKAKLEIERKYKIISQQDRLVDIENEIKLYEKNSLEEIRLQREKSQIITDIEKEQQQARLDKLKETNKKSEELYKNFKDTVKNVINDIFKALTEANAKQVQAQEKLIQKQSELVDKQEERAKLGLSNTLAFEQKALAQREADLIKSQKKQERMEKIKALYASYSSYAEKEENPNNAILKALRDFAILESITASFGDGGIVNDKLPSDGIFRGQSHRGNQGGIPILVEGREGIFSANEMNNLGRDNFYKMKDIASMGKVDSNFFSRQRKQFIQTTSGVSNRNDTELVNEMRGVKRAIENKPTERWEMNRLADGVIETIQTITTKNKVQRNIYKTKKPKL